MLFKRCSKAFCILSSLGTNFAKADLSNAMTVSFGQSGYAKFNNGLLIQYGTNGGGVNKSIYLPTAFYDTNYTVLTTSNDGNRTLVINHNVIARYTSYFKVTSTYLNNSTNTGVATTGFMFIAIGRWK